MSYDSIMFSIEDIIKDLEKHEPSRERDIAISKLEEAIMWLEKEIKWVNLKSTDQWETYATCTNRYIDEMRDNSEHKSYMLKSDRCFVEWVEEYYPERLDELWFPLALIRYSPVPNGMGLFYVRVAINVTVY